MINYSRPLRSEEKLLLSLAELARDLIVAGYELIPKRPRPRRGGTLRPGPHTPLWNAVVVSVRPHLRRRGAKVNLARMLGVPRQRVHEYFKTGSAAPDAERVLQIIVWLSQGAPKLVGPKGRIRWQKRRSGPRQEATATTQRKPESARPRVDDVI